MAASATLPDNLTKGVLAASLDIRKTTILPKPRLSRLRRNSSIERLHPPAVLAKGMQLMYDMILDSGLIDLRVGVMKSSDAAAAVAEPSPVERAWSCDDAGCCDWLHERYFISRN